MTEIALLGEFLFAVAFVAALVNAVRDRDALARDVALAFLPVSLVFVSQLIERLTGSPPPVLSVIASLFLLGQPVFTLRLVADVRPVAPPLLPIAVAYWGAVLLAVAALGPVVPLAVSIPLSALFVGLQAIAAAYLAAEARQRRGATRVRLSLAALATALLATALAALVLASALGPAGEVVVVACAVAAGAGYLVAFLPPGWLQRLWEANLGYTFFQEVISTLTDTSPDLVWSRLAGLIHDMTGSDVFVVVPAGPGRIRTVRAGRHGAAPETEVIAGDLPGLVAAALAHNGHPEGDPAGDALAARGPYRFLTVVPITAEGDTRAAIVLCRQYANLFRSDDAEMLAGLGLRAALVADRRQAVAEQAALNRRLNQTVAALQTASAAKSDFLASMSHELRTPLNAIIGFSELMRDEAAGAEEVTVPAEWVDHIHHGGVHLLGLINDVLDLSKVEAGRIDLTLESVEVDHAIVESVTGLRTLIDRKHLKVTWQLEPIVVEADRGRLRQILYNLLSNAIKYTPEGGSIVVDAHRRGAEIRISVSDTGVGISPADLAHVFEEFRQVGDPGRRQEGTGLGLALTRRLVEAHHGRIEAESAVGAGSRFTVILPASGADAAAAIQAATAPSAATPDPGPLAALPAALAAASNGHGNGRMNAHAGSHPNGRAPSPAVPGPARGAGAEVLVIEDDPGAVRLLRTYLEADGYTVFAARDGESGLAAARARAPAAIVLDIRLPTIDGWEVLRQLKSSEPLRAIPVIITTVVDERDVGLALGAVDYLTKPVSRDALVACVERFAPRSDHAAQPVRVLAVDDDPAALDIVDAALTPEGYDISRAGSGRAALSLARAHPYDLVICDLVMPDLNGFEVVSELKADVATRDVPILILTAHELSLTEKERLNGRIVGVVDKGERATAGLRDWLAHAVHGVRVGLATGAPLPGDAGGP
jgi:signal transduction histidine kinase/CheY-like chemotaxis protein